jgi:hypothetical protein
MEQDDNVVSAGKENKSDGLLMQEAITRLFNSHFSEVLDILSSRFPHTKGDGSANEVEFQGLRAKILRSGNNKVRKMPEVFKQYVICKVFEDAKVEEVRVATPVQVKED